MNVDEVLARLRSAKGQWPQICKETGLDYSWLTKFAQGSIHSPGARRLEKLAAHPLIQSEKSRSA